jgi:hypothetical protein
MRTKGTILSLNYIHLFFHFKYLIEMLLTRTLLRVFPESERTQHTAAAAKRAQTNKIEREREKRNVFL